MSKKRNLSLEEKADVDMTPMLDIVFILLIFFIVTTSFVKEEGFLINKPDENKSSSPTKPIILIKIDESGFISMNNRIVDIERLPASIESFLAKNETSNAVVIPHFNTTYNVVVKVLDQINMLEGLTVSIGK